VKLIKSSFVCDEPMTPNKLEKVNFIGSSIPGIKNYKIFNIPIKKGTTLSFMRN